MRQKHHAEPNQCLMMDDGMLRFFKKVYSHGNIIFLSQVPTEKIKKVYNHIVIYTLEGKSNSIVYE